MQMWKLIKRSLAQKQKIYFKSETLFEWGSLAAVDKKFSDIWDAIYLKFH